MRRLVRISVRGIVQGVGFRPFVYRLAQERGLAGWVRNTSGSVEIEAEGEEDALQGFLADLQAKAPPMAHIEGVAASFHKPKGYVDFTIIESLSQEGRYQLVSPDIATCADCRREIFDPADRRYRYPFTNCTNCGPRFTIIEDIPYDRPRTTMRRFTMCPQCQAEYDNPLDRRFHAQPNACPVCGPSLELVDGSGRRLEGDAISRTAALLKSGKILALRGLGGFHLACDATSEEAVKKLRDRKRRPAKPFAVMIGTIDEIERHCTVTAEEKSLLESPQAPIVLLWWKSGASTIAPSVAPGNSYMGVMLPYTPLHHLLLEESGLPLVMTSGNMSEEPIAKDNDEALQRLGGIADFFLLHDRDIYARYDDSVCIVEGEPRAVRRARSYAPYPVFLPYRSRRILACGAEEKNTFCLARDEHAFLSQHIGDMENMETLEHFQNTIELYQRLFRIEPELIACDMHPEYLPTKYALELAARKGLRAVPVQHHHAHIVSCMVENGTPEPVIGVAFDGTGYGTDGTIWGGEFLVCDWRGFRRAGHLEYVPLPGGAAAIRKPYRMALSYLHLAGEDYPLKFPASPQELEIIRHQIKQRLNSPLTSSAGRLFDAVSALCGVRGEISYEAQAAVELEMLAGGEGGASPYPFSISPGETKIVRLGETISAIVHDLKSGTPVSTVSLRFHITVAQIIVAVCRRISADTGIKRAVLSGGVFQNRLLFRLAKSSLEGEDFQVLTHRLVPCNDGGISLGQAAIANFTV